MELRLVVDALCALMPMMYALLVVMYGLTFFRTLEQVERIKVPVLSLTLAMHALYLGTRTALFDHPPITSVFEIMTLLAGALTLAYSYIEWRTNIRNTGFFIFILAFTFQTASSLFIRDIVKIPDYLHSLVLGFHVAAAILGYTAISLSAVYGLLYLMLYHEIKSTRFGLIFNRLPNLETIEGMSHKAEMLGFVSLTIAIAIGIVWLPRVFKNFSYLDPKLVGSMVIWFLYAIGISAKRKLGWQGRKMMIISLVAFGFVFLSMTVINMSMSSFHSFN
jgi:ABC-type uncharacterized transport system permease subunit